MEDAIKARKQEAVNRLLGFIEAEARGLGGGGGGGSSHGGPDGRESIGVDTDGAAVRKRKSNKSSERMKGSAFVAEERKLLIQEVDHNTTNLPL